MRAFIGWIVFKNEILQLLVKNEDNNENWPCFDRYVEDLKEWNNLIEEQQVQINQLEIKNNQTHQLIADVWTWFIQEFNLLGKPAKRALSEKEKEHLRLAQELKANQYNLDHPKTELKEFEKQCLLNKIKIGKRKIELAEEQMEELGKAFEEEKHELCQRLSYERKDLEPFLRNPEERIDPLTRKLIISSKQYHEWWKKFNDIDPESKALNNLNQRLTAWYNHNSGEGIEPNPCEIWVEEKTDDSLTFLWKPVELVIGKDENGKEIEGVFLPLLKNIFFNYYGEWYEVADYQQVGYNSVVVLAQRSIFYNDYWRLNKSSANVILHHSPLSHEEICSCPSSEHYTKWSTFDLDYKLEFDFYRLGKNEKKMAVFPENSKTTKLPYVYQGEPKKTDIDTEYRNFSGFWASGFEKGIIFLLLGKRFKGDFTKTHFSIPIWRPAQDAIINAANSQGATPPLFLDFKRVGEFDERENERKLGEPLAKFLVEQLLLSDEMYHFFKDHVKATLFWRNKPFWKGPYWLLHNQARLTETIGNDGNCVTLMGSGIVLGQVKELVTCVPGGDEKSLDFMKSIITVTTTIAAAATIPLTAGASTPVLAAAAAARAGIGVLGGMANFAANKIMGEVPYGENIQSMTIHEFMHKFAFSGTRPISLKVEFSQELANQYLNRRQLKGQMLYTYGNFNFFGEVLNQGDHYLKASVISWNMTRNSEWFRSKIESGIWLFRENHCSFYRKKLTKGLEAWGQGGVNDCDWNTIISKGETTTVRRVVGTFNRDDKQYSYETYLYTNDDNLYSQIRAHFGGHTTERGGVVGSEWSGSPIVGQKNVFCWGCDCKAFRAPITTGGEVVFLSKRGGTEQRMQIPSNCAIVCDPNNGQFIVETQEFRQQTSRNPNPTPAGIPPNERLPTDPAAANAPPATPFNPNQFPSSGNLIPNPTGSGEIEPIVPDIDNSPDPDFAQDLDPGIDPDPSEDPDQPTDPEVPPDTPPDPDDDDDKD